MSNLLNSVGQEESPICLEFCIFGCCIEMSKFRVHFHYIFNYNKEFIQLYNRITTMFIIHTGDLFTLSVSHIIDVIIQ